MPNTNLTKYQKGVYYTGIKLFNNLPPTIKSLNHDIKVFKPALKDYRLTHSYSADDFTSVENSCEMRFFVLVLKILKFMYVYM
jgi:hypothetical protein